MMRATVKSIADAIVDLVERTSGPVTLAEIADEIPGFSVDCRTDAAWCWETEDVLIWDGMTEDSCAALRHVVMTGRVAIHQSNALIYFLQGRYLEASNWVPIALVPSAKANYRTPRAAGVSTGRDPEAHRRRGSYNGSLRGAEDQSCKLILGYFPRGHHC